ncbi:8-oxoguanine glycosylase ogg1 [Zalaria obscura]|uniref:8-oxoguanine glycosylase ogg1 n=1 Tax=Zalaria obscura TaxID=2024903 RepID=A0ACC3SAB4_9PEZI
MRLPGPNPANAQGGPSITARGAASRTRFSRLEHLTSTSRSLHVLQVVYLQVLTHSTMGALNLQEWQKLPVSLAELCINTTLRCGQSFRSVEYSSLTSALLMAMASRWRKSDEGIWSMALHGRILSLYQDPEHLYYRTHFSSATNDDNLSLIQHYLNLKPNLTELYAQWSAADANFKKKAPKFTGIRILRQDAWEALVGFICSSNNNIVRISQMVDKLCRNYGPLIGSIEDVEYYDFPTPAALAKSGVEQKLRELGFGYRAKYLYQTACMVSEKEEGWLNALRNPESPILGIDAKPAGDWKQEGREGYRAAHEALLELQGVGPKVADCVCLMGLGWGEAVPVDTHGKSNRRETDVGKLTCFEVWQIAVKDYKFGKGKHSSLTKATYDAIGNKFRSLWGKEAGWAHSVLFTADLKAFSERLVAKTEVKEETEAVKQEDGETAIVETKTTTELTKKIKREAEDGEKTLLEIKENIVRRPKRARKA